MKISVEALLPSNLNDLIQVARAAFSETYASMGNKPVGIDRTYGEQTFTREKLLPHLQPTKTTLPLYLVGKCDGKTAGFSMLDAGDLPGSVANKNSICFSGSYILKRFQGQGLGKLFFEHRKNVALKLGYTGAWLSVWRINEPAVAYHQHMGFKTVGQLDWVFEHKGAQWHCDDLVMYQDL